MNVLVTGGAGYIGSHTVKALLEANHVVTVLDDLSKGHRAAVDKRAVFVRGSTSDATAVKTVLTERQIEAVLHFAASIEVAESVAEPAKYYRNNFVNTLCLLETCLSVGVKKFVFSSTAAVYGSPSTIPITEDHPCLPINPYGASKRMVEIGLEDLRAAHGLGYTCLRYFNVAGASPDSSIGEAHEPETHLVPRLLLAARDAGGRAAIFGTDYPTRDGTCVRDYVHVADLADAHVLALEHLEPGKGNIYNLGSESGFTVREVVSACERVTKTSFAVDLKDRRPGDPPTLIASSQKVRSELKWQPKYPDLDSIIEHAWQWHTSHPHGYNDQAN